MLPTIVRKRNYVSPSIFDDFLTDSFLPRFFDLGNESSGKSAPAVNVEETDKEYRIELAAPGLNKEDLRISVDDGVLSIFSEKSVS